MNEERPQTPLIKAAILVPSESMGKERHIYWVELLNLLARWEVSAKLEPVPSFWPSGEILYKDWHEYNLIIVTTDAVNGSREFDGDRALSYFDQTAQKENLVNWVRKGGIFFSEVQSRGGRPYQESYDVIFGPGALRVIPFGATERQNATHGSGYENLVPRERWASTRGSAAFVSKQYHSHPVSFGIHPFVCNGYSYSGEEVIPDHYREDRGSQFSLYFRCPETIYSGWFVDWASGWIPVLVESETARWPVLLVRIEEEGAWVASTMRLTSRETLPFVRNIVFFCRFRTLWLNYHKRTLRERKQRDFAWIFGLTLASGILLWLVGRIVGLGRVLQTLSWLHLVLGISVLFLGGLFLNLAIAFRRRPMGYPSLATVLRRLFWRQVNSLR